MRIKSPKFPFFHRQHRYKQWQFEAHFGPDLVTHCPLSIGGVELPTQKADAFLAKGTIHKKFLQNNKLSTEHAMKNTHILPPIFLGCFARLRYQEFYQRLE